MCARERRENKIRLAPRRRSSWRSKWVANMNAAQTSRRAAEKRVCARRREWKAADTQIRQHENISTDKKGTQERKMREGAHAHTRTLLCREERLKSRKTGEMSTGTKDSHKGRRERAYTHTTHTTHTRTRTHFCAGAEKATGGGWTSVKSTMSSGEGVCERDVWISIGLRDCLPSPWGMRERCMVFNMS